MAEEEDTFNSNDLLLNPIAAQLVPSQNTSTTSTSIQTTPQILIDTPPHLPATNQSVETTTTTNPIEKKNSKKSSKKSGLAKDYTLEYEDFDIDSYQEYSRNITNENTSNPNSGSTTSLNVSISNSQSNQPIMSSLCKLEKFSAAVKNETAPGTVAQNPPPQSIPPKQPPQPPQQLIGSPPGCVRSYIIGKNEIQLETKPPIKVIIEPTIETAVSANASPIGTPVMMPSSKSPAGPSYLFQRGSVLYLDPIKTPSSPISTQPIINSQIPTRYINNLLCFSLNRIKL